MTSKLQTRRLAAIVATDVAGFSRMMRQDEEGTLATLRDLKDRIVDPAVEDHAGRIVKTMGDGLLIAFDSVVEAIRCSIRIQNTVALRNADPPDGRHIVLRIGVNIGDVIEREGDVFGDAVNVAARLEGLADPGGICLSDAAMLQAGNRIDMRTEDLGEQALKNIDEPVRAHRIKSVTRPPKSDRSVTTPAFQSPHRRPSLAILPFRNLGAAQDNAYVADGISLGVQTLLVQLPNMFFVNACAHPVYRQGNITASEALADIPVKYAVEGWVQQAGEKLRVNVQVSDLEDGGILWAANYDRSLDDVFSLQDEIARQIAAALSVELIGGHLAHDFTGGLESPAAWENFLRGINHFYRMTKEGHAKAIPHFEALANAHPGNAIGPCYLSALHYYAAQHDWFGTQEEQMKKAEYWARYAIPIEDGNNGLGHAVLGAILLAKKQHQEALDLCHVAVGYRASCPFANSQLGVTQSYLGDFESGLRNIRHAISLRAFGPAPAELNALAIAYRDRGDLDLSITAARESSKIEPAFLDSLVTLASDFAMSGQSEQAAHTAREILRRRPGFSSGAFLDTQPYAGSETPARIADALRAAGLPD